MGKQLLMRNATLALHAGFGMDPAIRAIAAPIYARDAARQNHRGPQDLEAVLSLMGDAVRENLWKQPAVDLYANRQTLVAQQSGLSRRPEFREVGFVTAEQV